MKAKGQPPSDARDFIKDLAAMAKAAEIPNVLRARAKSATSSQSAESLPRAVPARPLSE